MLGTTFAFVFETQMELLQNGDRFYYSGAFLGPELLVRTRRQLVRDVDHAQHRSPALAGRRVLDAGLDARSRSIGTQFTDLGERQRRPDLERMIGPADEPLHADGLAQQSGDALGPDTNYIRYSGVGHVVLGGT